MTRKFLRARGRKVERALSLLVGAAFIVALVESAWAQGGGIQFPPRIVSKGNTGARTTTDPCTNPHPPGG